MKYFEYSEQELQALKQKDPQLKEIIEKIGKIEREKDEDLFCSVIHQIIGQQISMKAQQTIWHRIQENLPIINAENLIQAQDKMQSWGISSRKKEYILDFAFKVASNQFDCKAIPFMEDQKAIEALVSLKGIGTWTAEMILIFCLNRKNILSYDDQAIRKGLCLIYHHDTMDRLLFDEYKKRFSPYGSIASFYIWEIANKSK